MIRLQIPGGEVYHLAFAATGELYAAAERVYRLYAWDPGGERPSVIHVGRGGRVYGLTAARHRPWVAAWRYGGITVFDAGAL